MSADPNLLLFSRRASKAASRATWLAQPQNSAYFRDPVHVARLQAWRAAHPGYGRGRHRTPAALQDSLSALPPALAGLIAHLFELTLQDDMAVTTRRLVQLGHDVINGSRGDDKTTRKRRWVEGVARAAGGCRVGKRVHAEMLHRGSAENNVHI